MHDFILAKEVARELERILKEKKYKIIKKVIVEVGNVALGHDGLDEHEEDVNSDNLKFALESLMKNVEFDIRKTAGNNWKIKEIEI